MNSFINELVFLSNEGYLSKVFKETNIIIRIDCSQIVTKSDFFEEFKEAFNFPRAVDNWDAFSDWMTDLTFLGVEGSIRIELHNFQSFFNGDTYLQDYVIRLFWKSILPFWEDEVVRVTSGDVKPRRFCVYCIS